MSGQSLDNKEMNFDLDLLPVISMMSVCICFLLLTAVWTQIGTVNIEQGLGQESSRHDAKSPSLWITIQADGEVKLQMMDSPHLPETMRVKSFATGREGAGWNSVAQHTAKIKRLLPQLQTALIMPSKNARYADVIHLMDQLKTLEINEVGLAPL